MSELETRLERLEQNVQRINELLDNSLVIPIGVLDPQLQDQ